MIASKACHVVRSIRGSSNLAKHAPMLPASSRSIRSLPQRLLQLSPSITSVYHASMRRAARLGAIALDVVTECGTRTVRIGIGYGSWALLMRPSLNLGRVQQALTQEIEFGPAIHTPF